MAEIFWIGGNPPPGLHPTNEDLFVHPKNKSVLGVPGVGTPGLAIVMRPMDWLEIEMRALKAGGIDTLVSLLERREAEWLGLEDEGRAAERAGIEFLNFPIPDTTVPLNVGRFRAFVADLADRLRRGERIGVHCRGSIGRATVTAACTLVHLGWRAKDALAAVEAARGCRVPDTDEQQRWILAYEAGE
jgi:protein-tyrosine phosphatase